MAFMLDTDARVQNDKETAYESTDSEECSLMELKHKEHVKQKNGPPLKLVIKNVMSLLENREESLNGNSSDVSSETFTQTQDQDMVTSDDYPINPNNDSVPDLIKDSMNAAEARGNAQDGKASTNVDFLEERQRYHKEHVDVAYTHIKGNVEEGEHRGVNQRRTDSCSSNISSGSLLIDFPLSDDGNDEVFHNKKDIHQRKKTRTLAEVHSIRGKGTLRRYTTSKSGKKTKREHTTTYDNGSLSSHFRWKGDAKQGLSDRQGDNSSGEPMAFDRLKKKKNRPRKHGENPKWPGMKSKKPADFVQTGLLTNQSNTAKARGKYEQRLSTELPNYNWLQNKLEQLDVPDPDTTKGANKGDELKSKEEEPVSITRVKGVIEKDEIHLDDPSVLDNDDDDEFDGRLVIDEGSGSEKETGNNTSQTTQKNFNITEETQMTEHYKDTANEPLKIKPKRPYRRRSLEPMQKKRRGRSKRINWVMQIPTIHGPVVVKCGPNGVNPVPPNVLNGTTMTGTNAHGSNLRFCAIPMTSVATVQVPHVLPAARMIRPNVGYQAMVLPEQMQPTNLLPNHTNLASSQYNSVPKEPHAHPQHRPSNTVETLPRRSSSTGKEQGGTHQPVGHSYDTPRNKYSTSSESCNAITDKDSESGYSSLNSMRMDTPTLKTPPLCSPQIESHDRNFRGVNPNRGSNTETPPPLIKSAEFFNKDDPTQDSFANMSENTTNVRKDQQSGPVYYPYANAAPRTNVTQRNCELRHQMQERCEREGKEGTVRKHTSNPPPYHAATAEAQMSQRSEDIKVSVVKDEPNPSQRSVRMHPTPEGMMKDRNLNENIPGKVKHFRDSILRSPSPQEDTSLEADEDVIVKLKIFLEELDMAITKKELQLQSLYSKKALTVRALADQERTRKRILAQRSKVNGSNLESTQSDIRKPLISTEDEPRAKCLRTETKQTNTFEDSTKVQNYEIKPNMDIVHLSDDDTIEPGELVRNRNFRNKGYRSGAAAKQDLPVASLKPHMDNVDASYKINYPSIGFEPMRAIPTDRSLNHSALSRQEVTHRIPASSFTTQSSQLSSSNKRVRSHDTQRHHQMAAEGVQRAINKEYPNVIYTRPEPTVNPESLKLTSIHTFQQAHCQSQTGHSFMPQEPSRSGYSVDDAPYVQKLGMSHAIQGRGRGRGRGRRFRPGPMPHGQFRHSGREDQQKIEESGQVGPKRNLPTLMVMHPEEKCIQDGRSFAPTSGPVMMQFMHSANQKSESSHVVLKDAHSGFRGVPPPQIRNNEEKRVQTQADALTSLGQAGAAAIMNPANVIGKGHGVMLQNTAHQTFQDGSKPGYHQDIGHPQQQLVQNIIAQQSCLQHLQNHLKMCTLPQGQVVRPEAGQGYIITDFVSKEEPSDCSVCGKQAIFLCSVCQRAWYCSRQCQVSVWEQHQHICSQFVAASNVG